MAGWSSRARMKAWWRRTDFTPGWRNCSSRGRDGSRPPLHPVSQPSGRIRVLTGDDETLLQVEADGAGVVLIYLQIEPVRRQPLRFGEKGFSETGAPGFRRHHDLVEITRFRIDGDEAGHAAGAVGHHDIGVSH